MMTMPAKLYPERPKPLMSTSAHQIFARSTIWESFTSKTRLYNLGMKINLITIGKPKLAYAGAGFDEYFKRLSRLHSVRHTAIADKYAYSEV